MSIKGHYGHNFWELVDIWWWAMPDWLRNAQKYVKPITLSSVIGRDLKSHKGGSGFSRIHVAVAVGFEFHFRFSIFDFDFWWFCVCHIPFSTIYGWDEQQIRRRGETGNERGERETSGWGRGSEPIMLTFITCNRVILGEKLLSLFGNASHVPYKWLYIFKDIMLTVEIECAPAQTLSHTHSHTHAEIDTYEHIHKANKISPIFIEILTAITSWIPSRPWTHSSQREIFIIQFGFWPFCYVRNCYWLSNLQK